VYATLGEKVLARGGGRATVRDLRSVDDLQQVAVNRRAALARIEGPTQEADPDLVRAAAKLCRCSLRKRRLRLVQAEHHIDLARPPHDPFVYSKKVLELAENARILASLSGRVQAYAPILSIFQKVRIPLRGIGYPQTKS